MLTRIAEFTKTTLIGGLLVVLPIYVSLLLVAKSVQGLLAFFAPVAAQVPVSVHWHGLVTGAIIVGVCFLAGLVVRTGPGLRAKNAFEAAVLERIPGYSLIRGLTGRVTGTQADSTFAVALVEIEDALVPAFIVEELPNGNYTVFVPSVPTPAAGAIYILPASRVHPVDAPFTSGLSVITRWGQGAGDLLNALEKQRRESGTPST